MDTNNPLDHGLKLNFEDHEDPNDRDNFLSTPAEIVRKDIRWKETPLPEYDGFFATVLENCFTEGECKMLVSMAEAQNDGVWEEATINVGDGRQMKNLDARDCGRIIFDDRDIVQRIWNRVKASVPEIEYLIDVPRITGNGPAKRKEILRLSRLNERMRFLKYGEGQYFKPHMDGSYRTPDGLEYSFMTLHLYLNDSANGKIGGGATTFHSMNMLREYNVEPKVGRVLIFQHRDLLHSGADVTSGIKLTLRTDLMYRKVDE